MQQFVTDAFSQGYFVLSYPLDPGVIESN